MENQPTALDKAVKISIMVGFLIVALSISYYVLIFLPQEARLELEQQKQEQVLRDTEKESETKKELENKVIKCAEDAKKFHNEYIDSINGYYFEPKYTYNKNLGKCLYSGGYREKQLSEEDYLNENATGYWERIIKDVYTNETILQTWSGVTHEMILEFWDKHKELMNN